MIQNHERLEVIKNLFMFMDTGLSEETSLEWMKNASSDKIRPYIQETIRLMGDGAGFATALRKSGVISAMDEKRVEAILRSPDPCNTFLKYQHLFNGFDI